MLRSACSKLGRGCLQSFEKLFLLCGEGAGGEGGRPGGRESMFLRQRRQVQTQRGFFGGRGGRSGGQVGRAGGRVAGEQADRGVRQRGTGQEAEGARAGGSKPKGQARRQLRGAGR